MKKNLFAIEIAVAIILTTMLLTGIFLSEIIITWIAVGLIVLSGLAIVIIKIINLAKQGVQETNAKEGEDSEKKKNFFSDIKHAWRFSTYGERLKSLLFVFTILICSVAFIVLCSYGYVLPGLLVIGVGILLIICSLITMAIIEKILLKKHTQTKITTDEQCDNDCNSPSDENNSEEN